MPKKRSVCTIDLNKDEAEFLDKTLTWVSSRAESAGNFHAVNMSKSILGKLGEEK